MLEDCHVRPERIGEAGAMPVHRPLVLVVARDVGLLNQPWILRQISGFTQFEPKILCWQFVRPTEEPDITVSVSLMPTEANPYYGRKRWWLRLLNAWHGNFYAAPHGERRELLERIREIAPTVVLCYFGITALRLAEVVRELGIPLVAYFHGDVPIARDRWFRWSLYRRFRNFSAIVTVNRQEREWFVQHGVPEDKLHVIPCGAPVDLFLPADKRERMGVRFVMVSRIVDQKGWQVSIEAFARVASETGNITLDIYGDGPQRVELEESVRSRGLESLVRVHGYLSEQSLASLLPQNDIFIQHSLGSEGSPVSIVEAMLCGLPVVATGVGGIADQVADGVTGFLVAEHDVQAMAEAMRKLVSDRQLIRTMGLNGRKRALEMFDSAKSTKKLEQVVIGQCHPAPGTGAPHG